jgi:hypothetical protein
MLSRAAVTVETEWANGPTLGGGGGGGGGGDDNDDDNDNRKVIQY